MSKFDSKPASAGSKSNVSQMAVGDAVPSQMPLSYVKLAAGAPPKGGASGASSAKPK